MPGRVLSFSVPVRCIYSVNIQPPLLPTRGRLVASTHHILFSRLDISPFRPRHCRVSGVKRCCCCDPLRRKYIQKCPRVSDAAPRRAPFAFLTALMATTTTPSIPGGLFQPRNIQAGFCYTPHLPPSTGHVLHNKQSAGCLTSGSPPCCPALFTNTPQR